MKSIHRLWPLLLLAASPEALADTPPACRETQLPAAMDGIAAQRDSWLLLAAGISDGIRPGGQLQLTLLDIKSGKILASRLTSHQAVGVAMNDKYVFVALDNASALAVLKRSDLSELKLLPLSGAATKMLCVSDRWLFLFDGKSELFRLGAVQIDTRLN